MERSFVEVWSLSFDDIGLIEGVNRSGRVWFAFQLSFFRERARFPSRSGDVRADVLQYLAEQLGGAAPDTRDFEYGHPKIDMTTIQAKLGAGLSPTEIAREMGISRGTVYKAKAEMLTGNDIVEGSAT